MKSSLLVVAFLLLGLSFSGTASALVEAPVFTPASGVYSDYVTFSVSTATVGATIYFTRDGSIPTTASPIFGGQIDLFDSTIVKAVAAKDGEVSAVVTGNYQIVPLPTPTLHLNGKKSVKTSKTSVKIRGTSTDADSVEYQVNDGNSKTAKGVSPWTIKARLKPGKNIVTIYAIGEEEDSDPLTVTVTVTKKK